MKKATHTEYKYDREALTGLAILLLINAGLPEERSRVVAETLVEADLMGHTTHGLALLPAYLNELETGAMTKYGEPEVVRDLGATVIWDGGYLPGPWLLHQAIGLAIRRAGEHPVVTIVIRKSHHIACLAAYLERVTQQGLILLLSCSDPANKTVAPYGGLHAVYSPNPIAAGIPTSGDPILFDISTAATANGQVVQKYQACVLLPAPWLLDRHGQATADPAAFFDDPPATILPLGGLDTGYKGFALGLLVEALTNGLSGYGRAENPARWGASVMLQVINPEAFGGAGYLKKEMTRLVEACLAVPAMPGGAPVRIPGSKALALKQAQTEHGVALPAAVVRALEECASKYGVGMPEQINAQG